MEESSKTVKAKVEPTCNAGKRFKLSHIAMYQAVALKGDVRTSLNKHNTELYYDVDLQCAVVSCEDGDLLIPFTNISAMKL